MSCVIDEGDSFLITGSATSPHNIVSRYNSDGWVEDLGVMSEGRYYHGCTQYTDNVGEKVGCNDAMIFSTSVPD